jgi:hypothetical protein
MKSRQIYTLGAALLIAAVAIISVSEALRLLALNGGDPSSAGSSVYVPTYVLSLIGTTLFVIAFPITYARQAAAAGKTALIGLACYIGSGLVFGYGIAAISAIIVPFIYANPTSRTLLTSGHGPDGFTPFVIIGALLFTIGNLCYGIGTLRARVYPRALAFSLMVAAVLEIVGFVPVINLPVWTDLITDAASFGPVAAMAVWLLREARINAPQLDAPIRAAVSGARMMN